MHLSPSDEQMPTNRNQGDRAIRRPIVFINTMGSAKESALGLRPLQAWVVCVSDRKGR